MESGGDINEIDGRLGWGIVLITILIICISSWQAEIVRFVWEVQLNSFGSALGNLMGIRTSSV